MNLDRYYRFFYRLIWPFFNLFHPIRAIGRENIPEGGAVVAPNHSGLSDPVFACFAMTIHHRLQPMAKKEARKIPVVGKLLELGGVIFVDRGHADVKAVKTALSALRSGTKLLIFPQGTRVMDGKDKNGQSVEAKGGAALFATRAGVPILPVYISEKKRWFRPTTVVIGKPYYPQFEGRKPTSEELDGITDTMMAQIKALGDGL